MKQYHAMIWRSVSAIIAFLSISGYLKMHFRITSRTKRVVQFYGYMRMSQNVDSYFKCFRYLLNFTLFSFVYIFLFGVCLILIIPFQWYFSYNQKQIGMFLELQLHVKQLYCIAIIQMQSFLYEIEFLSFYPFIRATLLFT